MMTLDEGIEMFETAAQNSRRVAEGADKNDPFWTDVIRGNIRHAEEMEQIVEWLKELKALREVLNAWKIEEQNKEHK